MRFYLPFIGMGDGLSVHDCPVYSSVVTFGIML